MTSPTIDVTGHSTVLLEYYRWLNSDYLPYMHNKIDVFDGSTWTTIWASGASPAIFDSSWTLQQFEVSPYSNANFQLRIGFSIGSSGVFTVGSWNVDDFRIIGTTIPEPTFGFSICLASSALVLGLARRRRCSAAGVAKQTWSRCSGSRW